MPILRKYKCPDCSGTFEFLHMTSAEPPPENCDLCGNYMGEEPKPELAAPKYIGTPLSKSVDKVYASMEREIGVTNMKDNLREGDAAAISKIPDNEVTRFAAQTGMTYWQGEAPSAYIEQSKGGPQADKTGAAALRAIQGGLS